MYLPTDNKNITIIRSERKTLAIQIKNGEVIARAPKRMKEKDILAFIASKETWINSHVSQQLAKKQEYEKLQPFTQDELNALAQKAKQLLPAKIEYYAKRIGVSYNRITIRCHHTRWGSCSENGNLNFNCLLMLLPDRIIDSVVVHELCHRKHMNHSKLFYEEIAKVFPDYKACHKWLNENGAVYLSRLP
ncbi:MAG: M48 family metallopeptidase [Clostridia bacterium]|nr:M48 family metallopeptidase [Clostridia bacterium]